MIKAMGLFIPRASNGVTDLYEQPFAERLYRILLKTAGRFQCRDDRDRLHALFGIAGGATTGETTKIANFVKACSNISGQIIFAQYIDIVFRDARGRVEITGFVLVLMYCLWGSFYESRAKNWTVNRPDYAVSTKMSLVP
jgi:hypothetical protein